MFIVHNMFIVLFRYSFVVRCSFPDSTSGGLGVLTVPLVAVLVMVFVMTVVVIVTFLGLMLIVSRHSRNKG